MFSVGEYDKAAGALERAFGMEASNSERALWLCRGRARHLPEDGAGA
jgi:hypothetical protein